MSLCQHNFSRLGLSSPAQGAQELRTKRLLRAVVGYSQRRFSKKIQKMRLLVPRRNIPKWQGIVATASAWAGAICSANPDSRQATATAFDQAARPPCKHHHTTPKTSTSSNPLSKFGPSSLLLRAAALEAGPRDEGCRAATQRRLRRHALASTKDAGRHTKEMSAYVRVCKRSSPAKIPPAPLVQGLYGA